MKITGVFVALAVLSLVPVLPDAVSAQASPWDAGQLYATRAQLDSMLARHEDASRSAAYSDAIRTIARGEADLIRARLRDGDFEVGDQITMTVSGQPNLTGQFQVAPGRLLILPDIGAMPLTGLLRSELYESVTEFIARYIRDPQVYIQTSMRIQAVGGIGNPGYHSVTADARLPDVLASLGQPTRTANLEDMKIKRGKDTIWDGEPLQEAIVQGRTLDQLSLRAGDIIEIPEQSSSNIGQLIRGLYYLIPLSFTIMRLF